MGWSWASDVSVGVVHVKLYYIIYIKVMIRNVQRRGSILMFIERNSVG